MKYTYLESGVDIKKADELTSVIKNMVKTSRIGNFAGIFEHPVFDDYYLAACTDGIGTKIIPLIEKKDTKTIANDLFAMNLNDLICVGAKPLFFLDYIALNRLDTDFVSMFLKDLNLILQKYSCTLLGGETSELGNLIARGYFDAAGFLVGVVKKEKLIDKKNVCQGDVIIGLKSSGAHSNGFTLIRKLRQEGMLSDELFNASLEPVKIYSDIVYKLNEKGLIHSLANITGGGIESNLHRAVPENFNIKSDFNKIPKSPLFEKLKELTGVAEAYRTFNMGAGFCLVVASENVHEVLDRAADYEPFVFGEVV